MLLRRSALLAATFACAALALPAFASAKDYCFGNVPGCTPAAYDDSELQLALTEAQSNGTDDRFFLTAVLGSPSVQAWQISGDLYVNVIGLGDRSAAPPTGGCAWRRQCNLRLLTNKQRGRRSEPPH
jgi:hypothetical protein